MAQNGVFDFNNSMSVVCNDPTTPASGDPVLVGDMVGVAETDERTDGTTTVRFNCTRKVSVKGVNAGGNSAVAVGDTIYYVSADTPKLSKKVAGVRAGIALETVSSGGTATIRVRFGY
jgi:predicted RecA/RadA family phage recombinase